MALILPFKGVHPEIHPDAWLAPNATIIGDVHIAAGVSIWFGAVLRGDMGRIDVGEGSNVQDNVAVHNDLGENLTIGRNVGIGHLAIIHGSRIGDGSLIGMGATLLKGSVVGEGAFVTAGAVVLEGQTIEAGRFAAGVPAKDRGPLRGDIAERVRKNAFDYQELSAQYRAELHSAPSTEQ